MGIPQHREKGFTYVFCMLLLLFSLGIQIAFGAQNAVAPGVVLVKMKAGPGPLTLSKTASNRSLDEMIANVGITEIKKTFNKLHSSGAELERVYNFHFSPDKDPMEVARQLSSDPSVEYAEPRYLYELHATPDDPFFSSHQTHLSRMNLPDAWDITKGDSGEVVIAIIDDGVDLDHADIAGILWTNEDEIPDNGIDDDLNGYIDDIHGWNFANNTNDPNGIPGSPGYIQHGTRVAGQLAHTDNETIYAGVSWNTRMMVLNGAYQEVPLSILWVYESMIYAAHNGANIISMSGGRRGNYSQLEAEIIEYIQSLDILVITSAGNRNFNADFNPIYPGSYRGVLMVGATEKTSDKRAGFSVYGTSVDVFAPGVDIPIIWDNSNYSLDGGSGTSFCAPQVAGIAGLVWTHNPEWSADMVREKVRVSSIPIDDVNPSYAGKLGHGRVDALRALTQAGAPSVRVLESRVKNSIGGSEVIAGDTLTVAVDIVNYLAPVNNLTITASATYWPLNVIDTEISIPSLASNEKATLEFRVLIDGSLDLGTILCLYLDMNGDVEGAVTADTYVDKDYIPLHYREYETIDISTGVVQTTLSSDGNIGWTDHTMGSGLGFIYAGKNLLREAGILVGNSSDQVSNNIRSQPVSIQSDDFRPLTFWDSKDNAYFKTELRHSMDDAMSEAPLGIIIDQSVLYGSNQLPAIVNNGVLIAYDIMNNNNHVLKDLRFSVFADWDLSDDSLDQAIYDPGRKILYQKGTSNSADRLAGIFVANNEFEISASMINNDTVFADGFTDDEKWNLMRSDNLETLNDVDASLMLSLGPFDLMPNKKLTFMYVLFADDNLADVHTLTGTIQSVYDTVYPLEYSSTDPDDLLSEFRLYDNYPNPFNPSTMISYDLPAESAINITIFDIQGREIKKLLNTVQKEGSHEIAWDGSDVNGIQVNAGVYLCQVQTGGESRTIKMLLLK